MLSLLLLATAFLLPAALSAPAEEPARFMERQLVERQGGYYWSFWQEGGGSHNCQNGAGGSYTAKWSGGGGFVCGKGWQPGGSRAVKYSGTYTPVGPGYLALYGWTQSPLIEYYIVDNYDVLAPGEPWTFKGNFTSEEGDYSVYTSQRVNKPSIEGTRTFMQYWSVRSEKRTGGTITTGTHFSQWQKLGMNLGRHSYMILATEGFTNSSYPTPSGSSSITLS
ncbi:glycoside hydrolase family 11 protein [Trematosphaeria pertusa]|uniref:Endo-1,4-beta-xylanase n=1 Tax=Trematosphaeria pertusa TaxID=390896 RepID=A0A6A6I801_9PLEO|nr:glycoside hydrolase family 11 protein [Trematosphaeria pertusa]KAF2246092.1 glycoside hydrolase family 11 protein [Trematosphaeria pertusa]